MNSLIQGVTTDDANGNLSGDMDPLYANTALAIYSLSPCSPALNKGNNTYVTGISQDLNGNPRVFDDTVDLGVYELQAPQLKAATAVLNDSLFVCGMLDAEIPVQLKGSSPWQITYEYVTRNEQTVSGITDEKYRLSLTPISDTTVLHIVSVQDANCEIALNDSVTIIKRALPLGDIHGDSFVCSGDEAEYAISTASTIVSYVWSLVDLSNSIDDPSASSPTITWNASEDLSVQYTDEHGCVGTAEIQVSTSGRGTYSVNTDIRIYPTDDGNHFFVNVADVEPAEATYSYSFYSKKDNIALPYDATLNILTVPFSDSFDAKDIYLDFSGCHIDSQTVSVQPFPAAIATTVDTARAYAYTIENKNIYITNVNNELLSVISPNNAQLGILCAGMEELTPENAYYETSSGEYTYLSRRFKIKPENTPGDSVTVRFFFLEVELNDLGTRSLANGNSWDDLISLADLRVTKYEDSDQDDLSLLGGFTEPNTEGTPVRILQTGSYNSDYYYVDGKMNSFSTFYLHGGAELSPLPVKLLNFQAKCEHGSNLIWWETATETNNAFFAVERSLDGYMFTEVGKVSGAGNSTVIQAYIYRDFCDVADVPVYYRLKQVDYNGQSEYFSPEAVFCDAMKASLQYTLYPNPTNGVLHLDFMDATPYYAKVEIYNAIGLMVYHGHLSEELDISNLTAGIYFIRIYTDNEVFEVKRFEKN